MYDTEKRVAIVKKRIAEHRRRQARRSIRSLFALCVLLFLSLVGTVGTVGTVRGQPIDAAGMYGAILLHESAGGYVLVGVASFTAAAVLTVVCMRLHEREKRKKDNKPNKEERPT